ncbi:MAG: primase [Pseudomonadota bacterium]|jgi:DNA primase
MALIIPKDFIDTLVQRSDVVDVISKYIELKKAGSNYLGLCPFHNEKSPSFTVSSQKNLYHCFGCGAGGNALSFVKNYLNLEYVESVRHLAKIVGVTVPEVQSDKHNTGYTPKQDYSNQYTVLNTVDKFYQSELKKQPIAIDYLKNRGLTGIIAKKFGLGYASDSFSNLQNLGLSNELLTQTGMLSQKENKFFSRFRNRIMFPIRNKDGQVIAFGGRVFNGGEPKYLNSPETPLFNKSQTLYGLFESFEGIKSAKKALIVEGYMDVVALHQYGFNYSVATLGTACTEEHMQLLFRYTQHIIFAFDGDAAGERAALKALERVLPTLKDDRTVEFIFLPNPHDPDSYIRAFGVESFERLIQKAMPLSKLLLKVLTDGHNLDIAEHRAKVQAKAKSYLAKMPPIFLKQQIEQTLWGMTNTNNKVRISTANKWQQKTSKKTILSPIDTLMKAMFTQPIIASIISQDIKNWINYAYPYMQDFWQKCIEFNQNYDAEQVTAFWLNSNYANYYTRLVNTNEDNLILSEESLIEKNILLANSIAKQGINKKQSEILTQIEEYRTKNQSYQDLWQEYQNLAKILL